MDDYIKAQTDLRDELEKIDQNRVESRINKLTEGGGTKSEDFWKIRKKILSRARPDDGYDTITEDDVKMEHPDAAKEYIANFYENLYQARPGTKEYEGWTDHIKKTVAEIEKETKNLPPEPDFTTKELKEAIKSLRNGKAPGPDGIPNEAIKEADPQTQEIFRTEMNKILHSMEIPEQWTEGNLKRLYKGKGVKGKCSNERGITLASNVGKTFERLVNNRMTPLVNMSDAQAGGIKGRSTVDHILILKELTHIARENKTGIILTYLDVTKAYDKAWLEAILYVLHKEGLKNRLWLIVKRLNSNLKTTIQTKYGPTRKITIKDSIRQGGVLSVTMYALMMDEINKELQKTNLGIQINGTQEKIPCLLWMDDVVLAETTQKNAQKLLNVTNDTSQRYHVEFGMPKTKYLRAVKAQGTIELKLGERIIEETDKYTYLGEVNNKKMNLQEQIKNIEIKIELAYQTLITIAEDREFKKIRMEAIWKLVNTCIIPIITYASETWDPTKQELKNLNQALDKIIRRILMTPEATPRQALYIETGLTDIETTMDRKRLTMMARLNNDRSELMDKVLKRPNCVWLKRTKEIMEKYKITDEELQGEKNTTKKIIKEKTNKIFKERMMEPQEKSKIKFFLEHKKEWNPGKPATYMEKLTRKQVSTIFKARTRMTKVIANYKNGHRNHLCRLCKKEEETQQHIFSKCPENLQEHPIVTEGDIGGY